MVLEMAWLTAGMTVQLYVRGMLGVAIVCALLGGYGVCYRNRWMRMSPWAGWVALGFGVATLGSLGSYEPTDWFMPLHIGLVTLTLVGLFVSEYHQAEDARFVAGWMAGLLLFAVWQSITRNNLLAEWQEGSRRGVNLQALFIMMAAAYAILLKGRWRFLMVPFYVGLYWLGSRTGFFTGLAVPLIFLGLSRGARQEFVRQFSLRTIVLLAVVAAGLYAGLHQVNEAAVLPLDVTRQEAEAIKKGMVQRTELALYWLDFLWEHPALFGHGIGSYNHRYQAAWSPDNGFLHVFNGFGLICGGIYFGVFFAVLRRLWQRRAVLAPHYVWAGAFLFTMILRKFGESQLLVFPIHVAGFAVSYGVGLAIWAARPARLGYPARKPPVAVWAGAQNRLRPVARS